MQYARIEDGKVEEVLDLPNMLGSKKASASDFFTAEVAATLVPVSGASPAVGDLWDGQKFSAPKVPPVSAEELEAARGTTLNLIDSDAERARFKYITPGAGQALTYQEKAAELARYDEDTQPRLAEYPLLSAEIGITADSLKGVADAVRAALAAWRTAGAAIERTRLKAKADVEKARDVAAIQAVLDAIEWP